jgi:alpha-glucosidase/alpha-D-xyloside xylohydrolase
LPWGWNAGEIGPRESGERADYPPEAELHNAAVELICKKYLDLRYQLLPYNYTLAREACDTGLPPMRALLLACPDDPEAVKLGDEYLWGPNLLVAPVVEKGATTRRLYLPKGVWQDWWTGERLTGPRWVDRPVDLATLPLYARAGAVVPLDPVRQYTAQAVNEPTTLRIFPGADGTFTLYDDDGHSTAYQNDSDARAVWLRFRWNDAGRRLTIEPDPRVKGRPAGGARTFRVQVVGEPAAPKSVEFTGDGPVEVKL